MTADTELRMLLAVQRRASHPAVVGAARSLSFLGEHAWAWFAVSAAGAMCDRPRRASWAAAGTAVAVAHGGAVLAKRLVRRHRPAGDGLEVRGRTPSDLSFPSAHAASTTAAAVALAPLLGGRVTAPVPVAMGVARLVLGVHYPSDVLAGAIWGVGAAALVRRQVRRTGVAGVPA